MYSVISDIEAELIVQWQAATSCVGPKNECNRSPGVNSAMHAEMHLAICLEVFDKLNLIERTNERRRNASNLLFLQIYKLNDLYTT